MKKVIVLILCGMLVACSKEPVATVSTNNSKINVEELFTHSGITVYRFYDRGDPVYFTKPVSDVVSTRQEYCGKGCVDTKNTFTLNGDN